MINMEKFNSIDEIIEYLENYNKASWDEGENITLEDGREAYRMGYIIYDDKVFDILRYLKENKYIFEEYYNRDNYPQFFLEDINSYDFSSIGRDRISYLFFRTYNLERMNEGLIDRLCSDGTYLNAIKRLKELDKE